VEASQGNESYLNITRVVDYLLKFQWLGFSCTRYVAATML
jgi:hypothetical protein